MSRRARWIVSCLAVLGVAAALVWVVRGAHREEGDEAEAERITAPPPKISRDQLGEVVVELSRIQQERTGLETEILKPATRPEEVTAYGVILDPGPLISLNADLLSASAALSASRAEFQRTKRLHSEQ